MNITLRLCVLIGLLSTLVFLMGVDKCDKETRAGTFPDRNIMRCQLRGNLGGQADVWWNHIPTILEYCRACKDTTYCGWYEMRAKR